MTEIASIFGPLGILYQIVYFQSKRSYNLRKMMVCFEFQDRLLPVKIVQFMCDSEILFIYFITDYLIFDGQHIITDMFLK